MSEVLPKLEDMRRLLPGIGMAAGLFVVAFWLHRKESSRAFARIAALALPAAVFGTWWTLYGEFPWPAVQSTERGLWLTLIAPALAVFLPVRFVEDSDFSSLLRFAAIAGPFYLLLRPLLESSSASAITTMDFLVCVTATLLVTSLFTQINRGRGRALLPLAMGMSMVALSQILVIYGTASLAQLLGSAGTALLVISPFFLLSGTGPLFGWMIFSCVMIGALITLDAVSFGETVPPARNLSIVIGLPTLALLEPLLSRVKTAIWVRRLVIVLIMASVLAWTVKSAYDSKPEEEPNPYSDYEDWGK